MVYSNCIAGIDNSIAGLLEFPSYFIVAIVDTKGKVAVYTLNLSFKDPSVLTISVLEKCCTPMFVNVPSG
jgi:hypothetical protein